MVAHKASFVEECGDLIDIHGYKISTKPGYVYYIHAGPHGESIVVSTMERWPRQPCTSQYPEHLVLYAGSGWSSNDSPLAKAIRAVSPTSIRKVSYKIGDDRPLTVTVFRRGMARAKLAMSIHVLETFSHATVPLAAICYGYHWSSYIMKDARVRKI